MTSHTHPPCIRLALVFLLSLATGCAVDRAERRTTTDVPESREVFMEPLHIGATPDAKLGLSVFDAASLFAEGLRLQQAELCPKALPFYDRLLSEFPQSHHRSAAAFNAGRCLEILDKRDAAIARYQLIIRDMPRSRDWLDTAFRLVDNQAALGRHAEAIKVLDQLLKRDGLSTSDRLDALVLLGENLGAGGELNRAERSYMQALRLYRENAREEYLEPAPAARAEFRLAEMSERRFAAAPLRLPEAQMKADLETKAQLLLQTQAGYLRTIRHGDPHWAINAGYQVGKLYLHLHQAMDDAPVPADLSADEVTVYRNLLRQRLGVLLRKALTMFELTIRLSERTGAGSDWLTRLRTEMAAISTRVASLEEPGTGIPQPEVQNPESSPPNPDSEIRNPE